MKFKYNYLQKQLWWKFDEEYSYQIPEEQCFTTRYEGVAFILDPNNHWINFTIKKDHITVFYKQVYGEKLTYYKQELPKNESIVFEFSEEDQVEKDAKGYWKKKRV